MNCRDFDLNVLALARNQLIDAGKRDISLAHALSCVRCADRLAGERALITGVRAVVAELAEAKPPVHVGVALLTAFREQTPAATAHMVIPMSTRVARHWRLEAAAAILIMVSVLAVVWFYSRPPIEKQVALTMTSAPVGTQEPASSPRKNPEIAGQPETIRPGRARPRAARRNTKAIEEVTEFFPLMDGIDLDSLEAVQAVRVELPASALMDLGLRAGPQLPDGSVKADVLLGHDGLARAIRFVR